MTTTAFIKLCCHGKVDDDTTVTIGDRTERVRATHDGGGILASRRILETIDRMGYWSPDYFDTLRDVEGGCLVDVIEKAGERS